MKMKFVAKNILCLQPLSVPQRLVVSQMRSVFSNIVGASREPGDVLSIRNLLKSVLKMLTFLPIRICFLVCVYSRI